jgi:uncharacterized HAD superfamily protein
MRIVIDVDGVLLNFNRGFTQYYNTKHNKDLIENPDGWNWGITDPEQLTHLFTEIKAFIDGSPHLDLIDHRWPQFIRDMRKRHSIIIVTAYHNHHNRRDNLSAHGIEFDEIYFSQNFDKVKMITVLNPDVVIEDCPQHLNALSDALDPKVKIFVPSMWNYKREIREDAKRITYYDTVAELETLLTE